MQLLTVEEVAKKLSISMPNVWHKQRFTNGFPQSFKLSARQTRWLESDIVDYINSLRH